MNKQNKFNFKKVEAKVRKTLENTLVEAGNTAKNFFVESFRKQGWDDRSVIKWQPRKRTTYRTQKGNIKSDVGRAILVKTGDLRRSIIRHNANRSALTIRITSDLPYSRIHNEGLIGKAWGKHSFKMPKRQFMGKSYNLNEKVKEVMIKRLNKVFE